MSPPRKRADVLLVERGLFESRARARAAIEAGLVTADDKQVAKPSETSRLAPGQGWVVAVAVAPGPTAAEPETSWKLLFPLTQ